MKSDLDQAPATSRALLMITTLCLIAASACQLIGPLERELSGPEEELELESISPSCLLKGEGSAPWWVGAWEVDREYMKVQLFERLSIEPGPQEGTTTQQGGRTDTITSVFIASLAEHFSIQVTQQQANLMRQGSWKRFPISQLPRQAGVRLTSLEAHESSTLWCQGERAYWSAEGGSPLPIKRASSSASEASP